MANHKSAIKRHKQSLKKRARNRVAKSAIRTAVRNVRSVATEGKGDESAAALKAAERLLAKAAAKGIIPKGTARRSVSRLAKKVASTKK